MSRLASGRPLSWLGIVRLGLVQTALGSVVVLATSTMNRVMVVELALPALLPGALIALHYLVQFLRPRLGYGSDVGGRRTPWILGGMALLGVGGVAAAGSIAWMAQNRSAGIIAAVFSFALIGIGVGAAGTSLLVLLAKRVDAPRRAAAATTVWLMMIAGFAITAGLAGRLLDPYSPARLVEVTAGVALAALIVAFLGVRGIEGPAHAGARPAGGDGAAPQGRPKASFRAALAEVWDEPVARRFTVFVFVSMLAYSAQDLILEPFAGSVYGYTPGESTSLSGVQHGGVLLGMLLVAIAGSTFGGRRIGSLRGWSVGGCLASALALLGLAAAGFIGPAWPLRPSVFFLGVANGAFAVAAIGSMMNLAGEGHQSREGVRMGLWGAAQAVAFGLGGLLGTGAVDVTRALSAHTGNAYSFVFAAESAVFVVSAWLALGLGGTEASNPAARLSPRVLAPSQLSGAEAYATGRR